MNKLPTRRTISVTHYEPWLLGWCRWEIRTDLHYDEPGRVRHRSVLADGRWKWRGRHARFIEATVESELYFKGAPIERHPDKPVVSWYPPGYRRPA